MTLGTNFRRKLLILAIAPLAVAQLVMLLAVMQTVEADVDKRARGSLQIGAEVVTEFLASRSDQLKTSVQVLAADFGLKEAAVTGDAETIRSVLRNHSRRVGADNAMLLDLDGNVVATTDETVSHWRTDFTDLIKTDGITAARQMLEVVNSSTFQAFLVPLRAPTTIGWIVVGFRIDSAVVERMAALTGLGIVLVDRQTNSVLITSVDVRSDGMSGEKYLSPTGSSVNSVYVINEKDMDQLALSTPVLASTNRVQLVLTRSLQEAMAPYIEARRGLLIFAFALLSLVAVAAAWVAGGIARPLRMLTNAARQMSSGRYGSDVRVSSDDELGELASSFNTMRKAIAEREQRIFYQTMHDSLTDLPNREKIIRQLAMLIEKGPYPHVAVLSIRLSRMNEISSTLGHKASDELIKLAAKQLGGNIGSDALLGRTGSNEFVIAIGIHDPDEATRHAEQIGNSLGNGVLLESVSIALQTGIGVAIYPEHGSSASALLGNAMIAQSEAQFRDEPVAVYESGREEYYIRQLRIVNDLRSAIQKDQLFVCYQPKVSLETGLVCGAEALVRWEHPEYGYLPPDEFIPAAEEAGTIQYLTRYVMERAIKECRKWQDAGHSLQVSVNISARDLLDEYLPYFILQLLSEHKLPAERLTLEVTENMIMRKLQKAISVLDCLRDIGVKISMDDFGTGQSSLAQLKNIPLDELKVDKSFVMTLLSDTKNEAIVRTTLQLAENMDLAVVAEGVEDEATMNYLRTSRCQQVQGFYISKPIPDEEFLAWLDSRDSKVRIERRGPNRVFATKR